MAEGLSLQGYADHRKSQGLRGQTHASVLKAINTGRLTERSARKVGDRWYIDPAIADLEWAGATDSTRGGNGPGRVQSPPPRAEEEASSDPGLANVPSRNVSRAIREAYMARLARVEFERETGARVLADDVRKEAFEQGRRLRDALMNIPDRISNELAALAEPALVHLSLSNALRDALDTFLEQ
jgi:hypothetical protein